MFQYNICLISFLRSDEKIPDSFKKLKHELEKYFSVFPLIISESELKNLESDISNIILPNSTKYRKIKKTFNFINAEYYFCMDADISLNISKTIELINQSISKKIDISWGRIGVTSQKKYVEKLIEIDKILSHSIIRPTLWRFNVGITIPGQVFLFKKESLIKAFDFGDTFLDDLAVGAYVRENIKDLKILTTKSIIGLEIPSSNFKELLAQRKRWAKGYKSMYNITKHTKLFKYVLIHGFSYHFLWLIMYLFLIKLFFINNYLGILAVLIVLFFLSDKKITKIIHSINYMIIFPFIHLWWLYSLINRK